MAVLTISLTGAGTLTNITKTLSAGDLTKVLNAFTLLLQEQGVPSPTTQQVFAYWVDRWKADTITAVRQKEQTSAIATIPSVTMN